MTLTNQESNKKHHEYAQLLQLEYMREHWDRFSLPEDAPSMDAIRAQMAEIEAYFEAAHR